MKILEIFTKKNSLKRKILNIVDDIKTEVKAYCNERLWIDWYGAYEINPKNLAIWVCVKTDQTKQKLTSNRELKTKITDLLTKYDYPQQAKSSVAIGFESQETVDRESGGDWYIHFK